MPTKPVKEVTPIGVDMTVEDVAQRLTISKELARSLMKSQKIRSIKIGGWRTNTQWVNEFIESQLEASTESADSLAATR